MPQPYIEKQEKILKLLVYMNKIKNFFVLKYKKIIFKY